MADPLNNFQLVGAGAEVIPLLLAIKRQPELWNQNNLRTVHPDTPHKQVDDIWLRFNDLSEYQKSGEKSAVVDQHESIDYPAYAQLSEAKPLIMSLMNYVWGIRLGRVLITKMRPGTKIEPHVDGGSHAAYYSRFHIVLQSQPGSLFRAGAESLQMQTGEIWWFDNKQEHEVINNSADDRIHMIVDIRTSR